MKVTRGYEMLQQVTRGFLIKETPSGYFRRPAYEALKFYQDLCKLREIVYSVTQRFPSIHMRLISQMRDAARSAKQNIREGYRRGSAKEFAHAIRISQGSLEELLGDVEDCKTDGLITLGEYCEITDLCRSARYLSDRYLDSLYRMEKEKRWKDRGQI